jgi:hypothetical protein
MKTTCLCGA